jgi:hypothetical protein
VYIKACKLSGVVHRLPRTKIQSSRHSFGSYVRRLSRVVFCYGSLFITGRFLLWVAVYHESLFVVVVQRVSLQVVKVFESKPLRLPSSSYPREDTMSVTSDLSAPHLVSQYPSTPLHFTTNTNCQPRDLLPQWASICPILSITQLTDSRSITIYQPTTTSPDLENGIACTLQ